MMRATPSPAPANSRCANRMNLSDGQNRLGNRKGSIRSEDPTTDAADQISEATGGRCFRRAPHIEYSHRRTRRREFAGRRTAICRKEALPVAEIRAFPKG